MDLELDGTGHVRLTVAPARQQVRHTIDAAVAEHGVRRSGVGHALGSRRAGGRSAQTATIRGKRVNRSTHRVRPRSWPSTIDGRGGDVAVRRGDRVHSSYAPQPPKTLGRAQPYPANGKKATVRSASKFIEEVLASMDEAIRQAESRMDARE